MEIIAAIVGVIVGFLLSEGKDWWLRRRKLKGHWSALRAEAEACRQKAETYLKDNIMAPLYRLPSLARDSSLPELLVQGEITAEELANLSTMFNQISDFNRGLDLAQSRFEAAGTDTDPVLKQVYGRNQLYAKRLVPGNEDEVYSAAIRVIGRHT